MAYKTNITLRRRTLPSGRTTLYLDIVCGGRRRTESLGLFLVEERTRADRQRNRETERMAEEVLANRMAEARSERLGVDALHGGAANFREYFLGLARARRADVWGACLTQMERYDPSMGAMALRDVSPSWVRGFREWLCHEAVTVRGKRLRESSASVYLSCLKTCLNAAERDGLIGRSPARAVEGIRCETAERSFLTLDEVRRLAAMRQAGTVTGRAFLFSCLTGMRVSDVRRMTWGMVTRLGGFTRVTFSQQKTGGREYLDISDEAARLMGERGAAGAAVFGELLTKRAVNEFVGRWVAAAGIAKHITFHCARHTFAVMMLDIGTDIYTVSKLLGHREISTTQVYAKVLDKNKRAAVARMPSVMPGNE